MASHREVARAKKRFLEIATGRVWLMGVGVGLVDDELGLIISVDPKAKSAASRIVNRLSLEVPVALRGVEEIHARTADEQPDDDEDLDELRRIARLRMGDRDHR
ncbi:MAG: hypothetical protein GY716_13635 [bacterium]|nr:hypothetical protein [bacterium]